LVGSEPAASFNQYRLSLSNRMKVLALASYPVEAAATRFRLQQFVGPLAERDVELTIHPFLDSTLFAHLYHQGSFPRTAAGLLKSAFLRLADLNSARTADVILVQREAMMFGPPLIEWLTTKALKRPMVLDLDDATYVSYTSPTYGGVGKALKWFRKTDDLIGWARVVTCGNRAIAEYVSGRGAKARIIPTVVDNELFRPAERGAADGQAVLGWIGTHSTYPYLESIFPALRRLAGKHDFRLKIVGSGKDEVSIPGVEVENSTWKMEREVADFQSIDVGLYPLDAAMYEGWAAGKSGFKAIQYMGVGVPYVATPVGASAEIGEAGVTHFFASTEDEWYGALETLIVDARRRREMGAAGRRHAITNYGLPAQADKLCEALHEAAGRA
jgi:glycosyltransferase involved in cell wall biosynthesis